MKFKVNAKVQNGEVFFTVRADSEKEAEKKAKTLLGFLLKSYQELTIQREYEFVQKELWQ